MSHPPRHAPVLVATPQQHRRLAHMLLHAGLLHHLIDHQVCELRYTQPGTSRLVTVPVRYASGGERLVARVPDSHRQLWGSVFGVAYPVRILLDRRWWLGHAWLTTPGQPGWPEARRVHDRCYPDTPAGDEDVFLTVTLAHRR